MSVRLQFCRWLVVISCHSLVTRISDACQRHAEHVSPCHRCPTGVLTSGSDSDLCDPGRHAAIIKQGEARTCTQLTVHELHDLKSVVVNCRHCCQGCSSQPSVVSNYSGLVTQGPCKHGYHHATSRCRHVSGSCNWLTVASLDIAQRPFVASCIAVLSHSAARVPVAAFGTGSRRAP